MSLLANNIGIHYRGGRRHGWTGRDDRVSCPCDSQRRGNRQARVSVRERDRGRGGGRSGITSRPLMMFAGVSPGIRTLPGKRCYRRIDALLTLQRLTPDFSSFYLFHLLKNLPQICTPCHLEFVFLLNPEGVEINKKFFPKISTVAELPSTKILSLCFLFCFKIDFCLGTLEASTQ